MVKWQHFFRANPRAELKEIYWFESIFALASSLILIFEPVWFYQQGFSLAAIAGFYALHYLAYVIALPWGGKFSARFGLEAALALAMPIFVGYFLMLAVLPSVPELFGLAWVVLTLFKILYWPAAHTSWAKFGDQHNRGTELSWMLALTRGAGILGPVVGGIIATYWGFPVLFITAGVVALLAAGPLLKTKEHYLPRNFSYAGPWQVLASRRNRRVWWGMIGWVENLVDLVFWPIFMFIMLGGADELGLIVSLNVLLMVLLGFIVGEISDRMPRRQLLRLHLPFMVLGYLMRPLAASSLRVFLTESLARAAFVGIHLPMFHYLYRRAKQEGPLKFVVAFEMQLAVAKAVAATGLVIVFSLLPIYDGFVVTFFLAGIMALFYAAF